MSEHRQRVLAAIRANKPTPVDPPAIPDFDAPADRTATFRAALELTHTRVVQPGDVRLWLREQYGTQANLCSRVMEIKGDIDADNSGHPKNLAHVDTAILRAAVGVAENGAMWVSESACGQRVLPFIAQHLVLLLDKNQIVPHMHAGYATIQIDADGFGVWIAGPSKTADIEQSLVIGAHGPRSLVVVLE